MIRVWMGRRGEGASCGGVTVSWRGGADAWTRSGQKLCARWTQPGRDNRCSPATCWANRGSPHPPSSSAPTDRSLAPRPAAPRTPPTSKRWHSSRRCSPQPLTAPPSGADGWPRKGPGSSARVRVRHRCGLVGGTSHDALRSTSLARSHRQSSVRALPGSGCHITITCVGVHRIARAGRHSSSPLLLQTSCTMTGIEPWGFTGTW